MPASPASADPGRDDDLAWLDRDPMTAAELEASLDRLCEQDEGHPEDEAGQYGDFIPLTPEELAEIRQAAAAARREGGHHRAARAGPAGLGARVPWRVVEPRSRIRSGDGLRPAARLRAAGGRRRRRQ
jgi:hypothetical protein